MSGDGHPEFVGATNDCAGDVRFDQRVQLHLLEPSCVIRVYDSAALLGGVGVHRAERLRSAPVDQTGQQKSWAEHTPIADSVTEWNEKSLLTAHVARGGD